MTIDRRKLVQLGTAMTLGYAFPGVVVAATDASAAEFEEDFEQVIQQLQAALADRGFDQSPALPIVSDGLEFNGGLRHDSDLAVLPPATFVIQPCARVADVLEQERPDVLPVFHECACQQADSVDAEANVRMMISLLVEEFGLDPARLAFVSVPPAEALRPVITDIGFDFDTRVFIRDQAEALAARDSSGYFFPDPALPEFMVTMGVYYRLGEEGNAGIGMYPPSRNWTEIAEIVIEGPASPVLSIGVERLTLAKTGRFPKWEHRLDRLFATVEDDAAGGAPPAGIAHFQQ